MYAGAQPEFFGGRRGLLEYGHFDKRFMYGIQKKGPAGKKMGFFLQVLKLHLK